MWAALRGQVVTSVVYMRVWVLFTDWLKLAGGKVFLGAVAGLSAADTLVVDLHSH